MKQKLDQAQLAAALRKTRGNITHASELLGLERSGVWKKIQRNPELLKVMEDILEESKDRWEDKLEELGMKKDSVVAILAKLNAYARDRGYSRSQTDVNVSGHVMHDHRHLHLLLSESSKRLAGVSNDDLAAMIEERQRALPAPDEDEPPAVEILPPEEG